jgi:serine/threonine-protein kinase
MAQADRSGTGSLLPTEKGVYLNPRLSPGGRQIAVQIVGATGSDLWVYEIERGTLSRLTFEGENNTMPAWTPDGRRIAFTSARGDTRNIYWKRADGAGAAEQLTTGKNVQRPSSFSSDGKLLAFHEEDPETGWDLWVLPLEGERKPELFLATPAIEGIPVFSPDGRWIAYASNESGQFEVYVRPYGGTGGGSSRMGKWQISTNGGSFHRWTKNGRELIYREGANRWMRVPVTREGDSFRAGKPELLFESNVQDTGPSYNYDVSRDGEQFILLQREEQSTDTLDRSHLTFIFNWFDEVRRLVPAGKN